MIRLQIQFRFDPTKHFRATENPIRTPDFSQQPMFTRKKGSREKISRSLIFAVWAFHENLTRGEKVEEYGRDCYICGYHVYYEI